MYRSVGGKYTRTRVLSVDLHKALIAITIGASLGARYVDRNVIQMLFEEHFQFGLVVFFDKLKDPTIGPDHKQRAPFLQHRGNVIEAGGKGNELVACIVYCQSADGFRTLHTSILVGDDNHVVSERYNHLLAP